ncbi:AraC-like protein [Neobacillus bataviensis]|uniref:AraC-like protein n=1 Tax=Neobacillus bataviensis TaxID=220685 RepID=A0A561CTW1_9BACI|nr:AraC family transcriptional regulator [Neobacillus bataviensis]TWD94524.1 AraC-like protein [Neobacillus bataviensis]
MMKLRDSQLQVLWIARVDYAPNSGVKHHKHEFYQLQLIIDGEGEIEIDGKFYPVLANHCYLYKKGIVHRFHFIKETITLDFKFTVNEDLTSLIEKAHFTGGRPLHHLKSFKELFQLSNKNVKDPNPLLPFQIDAGFKSTLLGILQSQTYDGSQTTIDVSASNEGFPMVQYLKSNLHEKISLEDMASYFGFHPHYLIELFKKNLNTTPMQYLQSLRLEKAKDFLEFTSHSVAEIAELVGLTPPYFSRLCCERLGMPPSKIREQMRTVVGKDMILEQDFTLDSQPSISKMETL